jgi:hypothetical protein
MDADLLFDVENTEICVEKQAKHTTDNDIYPSKIQTMGARFGCDFEGKMFRLL